MTEICSTTSAEALVLGEEGRQVEVCYNQHRQATMTRPTSDDLSPPSAHEAAIRALLLQGQHGGVAALAREYGVRREKIYEVRERARSAVAEAFVARGTPARGTRTLSFNDADIARTVIALRVATPSSIRDEVALLPIIYGTGWSYGKIQATLVEAEQEAADRRRSLCGLARCRGA